MAFEVDEVIAATGFVTPLLDLPALGVATFGQSRLPAQTPFWESATVPGIFFAGTIGQGAKGLLKHGIPANSGAVQGARYNARVLAAHIARTRFGLAPVATRDRAGRARAVRGERAHPRAGDLAPARLPRPGRRLRARPRHPSTTGSSRWPRSSMAPAPTPWRSPSRRDGSGDVYPVLYTRIEGRLTEHRLDAHPLLDYETEATRRAIDGVLAGFGAGVR